VCARVAVRVWVVKSAVRCAALEEACAAESSLMSCSSCVDVNTQEGCRLGLQLIGTLHVHASYLYFSSSMSPYRFIPALSCPLLLLFLLLFLLLLLLLFLLLLLLFLPSPLLRSGKNFKVLFYLPYLLEVTLQRTVGYFSLCCTHTYTHTHTHIHTHIHWWIKQAPVCLFERSHRSSYS